MVLIEGVHDVGEVLKLALEIFSAAFEVWLQTKRKGE